MMKKFSSYAEYESWTDTFENASDYEEIPVAIDDGWKISIDMFTACKSYKTARYLLKNGGDEVAVIVRGMWGMEADSLYDKAVEMLEESAAAYIEQHPELKATPNSEDMWSYRDEREDVDDYDEEGWDE